MSPTYPSWAARWKAMARHERFHHKRVLGLWSRLLITSARRAEECAALAERAEQAEAAAAAQRSVLDRIASFSLDSTSRDMARVALTANDAGAALLAELRAARAVIATVKAVLAREQSQSAVTVALAKYDAAVRGGEG